MELCLTASSTTKLRVSAPQTHDWSNVHEGGEAHGIFNQLVGGTRYEYMILTVLQDF